VGKINLNPRLVKGGRCYDVVELARLYDVHPHTVRSWRKAGLTPIDDRRPVLFQGAVISAFLSGRRASVKRPCPPGNLYCLKCREPRPPAPLTIVFRPAVSGAGMLRASCSLCGTTMNRRANAAQVVDLLPGFTLVQARDRERIEECTVSRVNADDART
jgi:hypothetical protein